MMAGRPLLDIFRPNPRGPVQASLGFSEEDLAMGLRLLAGAGTGEGPSDPFERLREAIASGIEVAVPYTRKLDEHRGLYRLRPYELGFSRTGTPVLWAQVVEGTGARPLHASDPSTHGRHTDVIHGLLEDRIDWSGLDVTDRRFAPRWPLRPESV